jgi:glycosyltransferase involved in cell wall biosynthesis
MERADAGGLAPALRHGAVTMRILVVSDLPQFVTGGAEMQAARLIEAWLDAGHEVRCLGRRMGRGPVKLGRHALPVHRIHVSSLLGRWGRAASYFLSLAWLLLRHRRWADVVYTRFLGEAAATAALLKAIGVLRVPLVATPANTRGNGDTNLLRSLPFGRRLVRLLDRHCDAINLIADDMVDELRMAGFSGANFSRIPNGIPLGIVPMRAATAMPNFVAVGRFTPQKGYDVLLRAMALIRDRIAPGQVWMIGDGPERERLLALSNDLQVGDRIVWHGELPQPQVAHLLGQAHLFLLPSRYEGLSNAGLEAMERGLPLLLTQCGGLDRHIDAGMGWVVPPEDATALADALSQAVATGPHGLLEMGGRARQYAERTFDMSVVAGRYLALFERLRGGKPDIARGPAA